MKINGYYTKVVFTEQQCDILTDAFNRYIELSKYLSYYIYILILQFYLRDIYERYLVFKNSSGNFPDVTFR